MLRRLAAGLLVILLAGAAIALVTTGPAIGVDGGGIDRPPQTTPEGFNNTVFRIQVYDNGSAQWTVQHSTPLTSDEEVDQFRSFAETFTSQDTELYSNFRVRAQRLTAFGTNATGREMNATAFHRDARIDELGQTQGVVELSFRWSNFARTDGERVIVDDVFEGGMYIDAGQRLVMITGPNLTFVGVEPTPDSQDNPDSLGTSDTVTWFGEKQFADNRPLAEFGPANTSTGGGTTGSPTPTETPTVTEPAGGGGNNAMLPIAVLVVVLVGLGGGVAWYSGALSPTTGGDDGPQGGVTADTGGSESASGPAAGPVTTEEPAVADEELLSDEDRVLQLLEANGGRMKQVKIVEETDWSKSKVSMLLSDMEEEGDISKLRVGRENIISLSGEEPDAVGSPFDDE